MAVVPPIEVPVRLVIEPGDLRAVVAADADLLAVFHTSVHFRTAVDLAGMQPSSADAVRVLLLGLAQAARDYQRLADQLTSVLRSGLVQL
jgi:hypothetical protein